MPIFFFIDSHIIYINFVSITVIILIKTTRIEALVLSQAETVSGRDKNLKDDSFFLTKSMKSIFLVSGFKLYKPIIFSLPNASQKVEARQWLKDETWMNSRDICDYLTLYFIMLKNDQTYFQTFSSSNHLHVFSRKDWEGLLHLHSLHPNHILLYDYCGQRNRINYLEVFCKKRVLKKIAKFIEKHLCQGLFFNKSAGLSLQLY